MVYFQGVLSSRGKQILFVDADGASKFSDLDKLELNMATLKETAKEKAKENKKVRKQV